MEFSVQKYLQQNATIDQSESSIPEHLKIERKKKYHRTLYCKHFWFESGGLLLIWTVTNCDCRYMTHTVNVLLTLMRWTHSSLLFLKAQKRSV